MSGEILHRTRGLMVSVNNNSNSGGRKWTPIFEYQSWVQQNKI